jgi:DNA-binding response OmpR family regulator
MCCHAIVVVAACARETGVAGLFDLQRGADGGLDGQVLLRVECDGVAVELAAKEFALLHALLQNAGRALSKTQLEQHLYAWDDEIGSNTVEVYIHHLRRKLGADVIRTLRGIGYVVTKDGSPK